MIDPQSATDAGSMGFASARSVLWFRAIYPLAALVALLVTSGVADAPVGGLVLLALASGSASLLGLVPVLEAKQPSLLVGLLVADVVMWTGVLAATGGISNPFTLLYFVQVTLAAVSLPPFGVAAVVASSAVGYGALFFIGGEHAGHHATAYASHLRGMWLAFTLAATVIGAFVSRLARAFVEEREMRARTSRLLGLTTLAAGAAHELANPLGTIKLVAADLERELRGDGAGEWADDTRVILDEVDRARDVLDRLSEGSGELRGEGLREVELDALVEELSTRLGPRWSRVRVQVDPELARSSLRIPLQATAQALGHLVHNGIDASAPEDPVELNIGKARRSVRFAVRDAGEGMSEAVAKRVGEPFFTTKEPGCGMGLGVFLTRAVVDQLGGRFRLRSKLGEGTEAIIELPRST